MPRVLGGLVALAVVLGVFLMESGGRVSSLTGPGTLDVDLSMLDIAFVSDRDGNDEIYIGDLDRTTVLRLTNYGGTDHFPAWSPDGTKIAFASDRLDVGETPPEVPRLNIYVMDVTGAEEANIVRITTDGGTHPTWSPDGTRIAFVSVRNDFSDIYVADVAGGPEANVVQLTFTGDADDPAWYPGTSIAFTRYFEGGAAIWSMDGDGSNQTQLTFPPADPCLMNFFDTDPAWSESGALAFSSEDACGAREIYTIANPTGVQPDGRVLLSPVEGLENANGEP